MLNVTAVVNDRAEIILDVRQEVSSVEQPTLTAAIQSPPSPTASSRPGRGAQRPHGRPGRHPQRARFAPPEQDAPGGDPLLGLAFQGKDVQRQQSELVILITPTIVIQPADAARMSQDILSSVVNINRIDSLLTPKEINENDLLWR